MKKIIYACIVLLFTIALSGTLYGINFISQVVPLSMGEKYVLFALAVVVFIFAGFIIDSLTVRKDRLRNRLQKEYNELILSLEQGLARFEQLKPKCEQLKNSDDWLAIKRGLNTYIQNYQFKHGLPTKVSTIFILCNECDEHSSKFSEAVISLFACLTEADISAHRKWINGSYLPHLKVLSV